MENERQIEDQKYIPNEALTPAELVKKHISDLKHVITEDQMRNLKVGREAESDVELRKRINEKEVEEGLGSTHIINPYDILDA